ncbi:hypothetical protein [Nonomuraea recticatena]|jgi:hypothetical protein|uniref:Uncharacterized protein n=1 Tax=Nonomuraea recticatena TaxID=46178 RepID=A0ABN3T8K4_9ACTN
MAWESGFYYLAAGQSWPYWVSWGDTDQGLQYIVPDPRGGGVLRTHTEDYGIQKVAQFGGSPKISYWVTVKNHSTVGSYFALRGNRVG